jgi:hypothetical protein
MSSPPGIHYLVPDSDTPSWGIGLLYHHVRLLRQAGYEACVLHQRRPFRLSWMATDVPIRYLDDRAVVLRREDLLVIPEVLAHQAPALSLPGRRVVFVQGSYLIQPGAREAIDYRALGYEAAIAVLPHVRDIVRDHHGLEAVIVPPFIADYFLADAAAVERPREPVVLLVSKPEYRRAGYFDVEIVSALLRRQLSGSNARGWRLEELTGRTHVQTAEAMQRAALLVNLNTLEAFNTTVPEAMAAGCIPICYEAFGGRDFLRPGVNAFVFPNNHVYPLVNELLSLMREYDARQPELRALRRAGRETAGRFREEQTAVALQGFFACLLR